MTESPRVSLSLVQVKAIFQLRFEYDTTSYNILRGAYEELCAFEQ